MALFKFLHTPEPKQYNFVPRYYNAEKEDLLNRLNQTEQSAESNDPEAIKLRISRGFKQKFRQDQKFRKQQRKKSNLRLVITIVVLFFITYLLLIKYLPHIENYLS